MPNVNGETASDEATDGGQNLVDDPSVRLAQVEDTLAYLAADFENYKRQTERRVKEASERAARRLLDDLLPALDNFNLAVLHAGTAKDVASLKQGLDFVAQQMEGSLKAAGLEPIDAKGKPFDPMRHEAIEEVTVEGVAPGIVTEETQKGYLYAGQVLRPSRVRVAR